jgi:hypothetical protein
MKGGARCGLAVRKLVPLVVDFDVGAITRGGSSLMVQPKSRLPPEQELAVISYVPSYRTQLTPSRIGCTDAATEVGTIRKSSAMPLAFVFRPLWTPMGLLADFPPTPLQNSSIWCFSDPYGQKASPRQTVMVAEGCLCLMEGRKGRSAHGGIEV